ncbi:MAG: periplasmic heavy metal sensor [Phycisphaerae bacterium]|jgi:Spy/CpxP family protein refolding chaperone
MKTTLVICVLVGAFTASAGLNVYHAAQPVPVPAVCDQPCGRMAGGEGVCPLTQAVGLTEAQRERLNGCCRGTCARQRSAVRDRLRQLMTELQDALNANPIDLEQVDSLTEKIAAARAQEWQERIRCVLQVRELLTPEQVQQLMAAVESP